MDENIQLFWRASRVPDPSMDAYKDLMVWAGTLAAASGAGAFFGALGGVVGATRIKWRPPQLPHLEERRSSFRSEDPGPNGAIVGRMKEKMSIFHGFSLGISIRVENYGIERKENCSQL
jgi:hypothetical protein